MKTIRNIFISAVLVLFTAGCGGGGYYDDGYYDDGDDYYDGGSGGGISGLTVVNASSSDSSICYVWSVPNSSASWGSNILGGTISPGYSHYWSTANCDQQWALKVKFCDGYEDETYFYRACGINYEKVFRDY